MTARGGQGQGASTEEKIRGIYGLLKMNIDMVRGIRSRKTSAAAYFHFDLNCGCGWNHRVNPPHGVMGSPLVFLQAAVDTGFDNYRAWFVDENPQATDELIRQAELMTTDGSIESELSVVTSDNGDFCESIPDFIKQGGDRPEFALGTILLDPNGPNGVPWAQLQAVFAQCERLDCIFNFPGTGMKRLPEGHINRVQLKDVPELFRKSHWLVREPMPSQQFTLLMGRNTESGDWSKAGFHHWDSRRGREIREEVSSPARSYVHPDQGTFDF
ncbi:MAG: three-Cys-motif partner protein TcmP [Gammaproteobacteria bacterium]|nr:three-Cys-motif partner protein TcmP [Gammaproteobacteria bacterium]